MPRDSGIGRRGLPEGVKPGMGRINLTRAKKTKNYFEMASTEFPRALQRAFDLRPDGRTGQFRRGYLT